MSVLPFPKALNEDVRKTLAELYEHARRNEITGICWIVARADGGHQAGMSGSYRADPDTAIKATTKAMSNLYTYAARKRLDPLTATDFMRANR